MIELLISCAMPPAKVMIMSTRPAGRYGVFTLLAIAKGRIALDGHVLLCGAWVSVVASKSGSASNGAFS